MGKRMPLNEYYELCEGGICHDLLTEEEKRQAAKGTIYLSGVVQRADAKNQNGRIYPRRILEREVNNYKRLINDRRALGELDHPDCLREGAEILTDTGWKEFKDISDNETVVTLNPETNEIEYHQINKKINDSYSGKMFHFKSRNIDTMVTPNHKFWVVDRNGNKNFVTAQEIFENRKKYNHSYIPKTGNWNKKSDSEYIFDGVQIEHKMPHELRKKYSQKLVFNKNTWFAFLGFYLAKGHTGDSFSVFITQKEGETAEKFRQVLNDFPDEIKINENHKKNEFGNDIVVFSFSDARIQLYLKTLGKVHNKWIPKEIKDESAEYLNILLNWFVKGDGRERKSDKYVATDVFSTSKTLIDDLHEIILKIGKSGNTSTRYPEDRSFGDRIILSENQKDLHFINISSTKGIYLDERFLNIDEVQYDGNIYCVNVPNHIFYCRDNDKCFWSGNSDIVNLSNASHMVTDLWWDGNDLMGKLKVLSTPSGKILEALINDGVKLGISSRGLGSLTEGYGGKMVGDDFELICFDMVSEPSTIDAFMLEEAVKRAKQIFDKPYRLNKLMNEILGVYNEKRRIR